MKAAREADSERKWRAIAEKVRLALGTVREALLRDPQEAASFVITSDSESCDLAR